MSLFAELKRRNVFRVAVAYAIVSWLLLQVADVLFPALRLPEWTVTLVAALLVLGFPVAMTLSWAYDMTPRGLEPTSPESPAETASRSPRRTFDIAVIALLAVAVGFLFIRDYVDNEAPSAATADVGQNAPESPTSVDGPAAAAASTSVLPNSVAVLLCDNLSPDPQDAFFAAGIHEEILNQLAKISALNVIARTSVLQYVENRPPIPQIADELNVQTVMECSVRYAGDAILVTAQLIDPATNSHLWSETYPGDLSDLSGLFAMQADIAMNIANAVGAEFSVAEVEEIERPPTDSSSAYALYLEALRLSSGVGGFGLGGNRTDAIALLERAIAIDPAFALAHGQLALTLANRGRGGPFDGDNWTTVVRQAAERALELDPSISSAWAALAAPLQENSQWIEAENAYATAVRLNPKDVNVLAAYGTFKRDLGAYEESVELFSRAAETDPNSGQAHYQLGVSARYAGDFERSATSLHRAIELAPTNPTRYVQLGLTEIAAGRTEDGIGNFRLAEDLFGDSAQADRLAQIALGYARAGRRDDINRLLVSIATELSEGEYPPERRAAISVIESIATDDFNEAYERLDALLQDTGRSREYLLAQLKANDLRFPEMDEPAWRALRDRINPR